MKTIRIALVPTTRTDLLCVGCGFFLMRTKGFALIGPGQTDKDAQAGVHRACIRSLKARVVRTRRSELSDLGGGANTPPMLEGT